MIKKIIVNMIYIWVFANITNAIILLSIYGKITFFYVVGMIVSGFFVIILGYIDFRKLRLSDN